MNKLTLISFMVEGRRKSIFVNLPNVTTPRLNGKMDHVVRLSGHQWNEAMEKAGFGGLIRGSAVTTG
jgi:hypothetical protein